MPEARGGKRPGAGRKPRTVNVETRKGSLRLTLDYDASADRKRVAATAFAVLDAVIKSDEAPLELRVKAACAVLDRVEGKARQMVRLTFADDPDGTQVVYYERPTIIYDRDGNEFVEGAGSEAETEADGDAA